MRYAAVVDVGSDDPHGRVQHAIANIEALWADPARQHLPHAELYAAARQDIMTLLRHLHTPARQAALEQHDRAIAAEAYLTAIGRLLHTVFATPALAAGLQVYQVPGAPESLYHQLQALLLAPVVQPLLPAADTAPAGLPVASVLEGGEEALAALGDSEIAQQLVDEHAAAVASLHPVPAGYHEGQAALLGEDTGVEPAL